MSEMQNMVDSPGVMVTPVRRRIKIPPSVIDERLLPPPQVVDIEGRRALLPLLSYEAWAWYQALLYWIPGRVGWLMRQAAYRPFFQRAGKGWHVGEYASIQRVSRFQIGHRCSVGRYCVINAIGGVILGDYSGLGPFTQLITATHNFRKVKDTDLPYGAQPRVLEMAPIVIESNTWVGANCVVLPGVRIGANSVVAAGSVVFKDVPPYSMVGGSPARLIWKSSKEEYESSEGEFVLRSLVEHIQKKRERASEG